MAVAEKVKVERVEILPARRFTVADLNEHGGWIVHRLVKALPDLTAAGLRGWVSGLISSNSHLFLYQPHSVALAQLISSDGLDTHPIVREKFVFAMDGGYVNEAAQLYVAMQQWAIGHGAPILEVEILTDVPHETIREVLGGRLFTRQQTFVRLQKEK